MLSIEKNSNSMAFRDVVEKNIDCFKCNISETRKSNAELTTSHCSSELHEDITVSSSASSDYSDNKTRIDDIIVTVGNTALSDLEDVNKVFNIVSDCLFFFGSVCYLVVASLQASHVTTDTAEILPWISILSVAGPILYALNANVDIIWAMHNQQASPNKRSLLRRRESSWDLCSNLFFGFAAAIDVAAAVNHLIRSEDLVFESKLTFLSAHLYLLSGLVSVVSFDFSCSPLHQFLIGSGDIIFLIGSICDLVLTYVARNLSDPVRIESFGLISCTLWLVNSMMYVVADLLEYKGRKKTLKGFKKCNLVVDIV